MSLNFIQKLIEEKIFSKEDEIIYIGDSLTEVGYEFYLKDLVKVIPFIIDEIPQHHYFLSKDFKKDYLYIIENEIELVKFFRTSDEETYSLQIDDHFEVLTKKTQISPGINITDLEGKIGVKVDVFTGLTLFNLQNHNSKLTKKLRQTNYLVHRSFFVIVFADYLPPKRNIFVQSNAHFFRKFELI